MNNIGIVVKHIYVSIFLVLMVKLTPVNGIFPQILTEAHNQTANLSSSTVLTCQVRDLGEHHVTWLKIDPHTSLSTPLAVGKQLFTTDKRFSVSFYSTSKRDSYWSLEIYQITLLDEGTYVCKITNRKASVSIDIHLHIQIPMIIHPTYVYAEPSTNIVLNCSALANGIDDKNTSKSIITWQFLPSHMNRTKPHDVIIIKSFVNNIITSSLTINHAQIYHTGVWTCIYKKQRLSTKVVVEKDILMHRRASALLSNDSNKQIRSKMLLFRLLLLFYIYLLFINI